MLHVRGELHIHIDTSIHFKVKYEAFKKTRKETFELPPTYWPEDIFTSLTEGQGVYLQGQI